MNESAPGKKVSDKVLQILEEVKSNNLSSGDLALKLNTFLTTRGLERDGKEVSDIAKKTTEEIEKLYGGHLSHEEIYDLRRELELLHQEKKRSPI